MDLLDAAMRAQHVQCHSLYKAMSSNNLSDVVLAADKILKNIHFYTSIVRERPIKCEQKSNAIREDGNAAYCNNKFQLALMCYNKALAFAPENSRAMKLVYSNRSALLLKNHYFIACLNDIEKCFAMGCPDDIKDKMSKRKTEVLQYIWMEKKALELSNTTYMRNFFNTKGPVNPDIPCAIADVGIIEERDQKRIIVTKDIKVGTVLSNETAFSTMQSKKLKYFGCYHCCHLSMNLMPCPGCHHVLFCSEECKNTSMDDGHKFECPIMDIVYIVNTPKVHFALKSALKIKTRCYSWQEYIDIANNLENTDKTQTSTNKEIYSFNERGSLLNVKSDSIFIHGQLHTNSFVCAILRRFLRHVPSFLPPNREARHDALDAVFKIVLYLTLYEPGIVITPCASSIRQKKTVFHEYNIGALSFTGKLKHSCHPNCMEVGLNNKVALLAIEPIKSGTEITVSKFGQYSIHDDIMVNGRISRNSTMFRIYHKVCECVCTKDKLTEDQKNLVLKHYNRDLIEKPDNNTERVFPKLVEAITNLWDVTHSYEYKEIFKLFNRCIIRAQDVAIRNAMIDFEHLALAIHI